MKTRSGKVIRDKRCFVVSPISTDGSDARQRADKILKYIIKPTCEELGFKAYRADEMMSPSLISPRVMREILTADLVIADLTGANPNVYYELAVRHFVGKPVVQLIEQGEDIPFDISDVNTIRVDHKDLDSVHKATERLAAFIREGIKCDAHENPLSGVLNALGITVQGVAGCPKPLTQLFEELSQQVVEELTASRQERDLLWEKFQQCVDGGNSQKQEPRESPGDLSGSWQSNLGAVRLMQDGKDVFGKYEYGTGKGEGRGWVGEIRGRIVGSRIVFRWQWTDYGLLQGIGYWDIQDTQLKGRWFYHYEHDASVTEMEQNPWLFNTGNEAILTDEERNWTLRR
jgi:hypothetical protein